MVQVVVIENPISIKPVSCASHGMLQGTLYINPYDIMSLFH